MTTVILALTSLSNCLWGQTMMYFPIDTSGQWCEQASFGVTCGIQERAIHFFSGDTIINNLSYFSIERSGNMNCVSQYTYFNNEYVGALREDTSMKKVYYVEPAQTTEALLYDFNLGVGDTLHLPTAGYRVVMLDSVFVNGNFRNRWWLELDSMTNDSAWIIEGVGSQRGLCRLQLQGVEYTSWLNEYRDINQQVFIPDSGNMCQVVLSIHDPLENLVPVIYPNPNDGHFTLSFELAEAKDALIVLTDATGRMITKDERHDVMYYKREFGAGELANGVYLITITTADGSTTRKLSIQQ